MKCLTQGCKGQIHREVRIVFSLLRFTLTSSPFSLVHGSNALHSAYLHG
jgi:hypothetical protein